jgi:hypothetical protein
LYCEWTFPYCPHNNILFLSKILRLHFHSISLHPFYRLQLDCSSILPSTYIAKHYDWKAGEDEKMQWRGMNKDENEKVVGYAFSPLCMVILVWPYEYVHIHLQLDWLSLWHWLTLWDYYLQWDDFHHIHDGNDVEWMMVKIFHDI